MRTLHVGRLSYRIMRGSATTLPNQPSFRWAAVWPASSDLKGSESTRSVRVISTRGTSSHHTSFFTCPSSTLRAPSSTSNPFRAICFFISFDARTSIYIYINCALDVQSGTRSCVERYCCCSYASKPELVSLDLTG